MASVTDLVTSGDNEEPIFPVRYYRHYMYCDTCGSFEIEPWTEPDNHRQLLKMSQRLNRLAGFAIFATIVSVVVAVLGMPLCLAPSLIALVGSVGVAAYLQSRVRDYGVRCKTCGTMYAFGSAFFTDPEANPRNYTMQDVPRPLYNVYQLRGEEVGPA